MGRLLLFLLFSLRRPAALARDGPAVSSASAAISARAVAALMVDDVVDIDA
jgi:hypothetical protein